MGRGGQQDQLRHKIKMNQTKTHTQEDKSISFSSTLLLASLSLCYPFVSGNHVTLFLTCLFFPLFFLSAICLSVFFILSARYTVIHLNTFTSQHI